MVMHIRNTADGRVKITDDNGIENIYEKIGIA